MKTALAILLLLALALCTSGQETNFAIRVRADFDDPEHGLRDLTFLQGAAPMLEVMPMRGTTAIAADSDMTVQFILGPTATNSFITTNAYLSAGNSYFIQLPTIGTNTCPAGSDAPAAWWYSILFTKDARPYWAGNGKTYIEKTTATEGGNDWYTYVPGGLTNVNVNGNLGSITGGTAYISVTVGVEYDSTFTNWLATNEAIALAESALQAETDPTYATGGVTRAGFTVDGNTTSSWDALTQTLSIYGDGGGEDWSTYPATNPVNGGGQVFSNLSLASPKITGTVRNAWNEPIISSSEIGNDGELVVGYQYVTGRYNQVRLPDVGPVKIGRQGEQGTNIVIMDDDGFRYLFGTNVLAVKTNMTLNGIPVGQGTGDGGAASNVVVDATPANYTPADTNVEAHLAGIDDRIGEIGLTNFFFGQPWRVITNDYTVDTNHADYAIGADTQQTNIWITLPNMGDLFTSIIVRKFTNTNELYIMRNGTTNWTLYADGAVVAYDWWPNKTNWYWRTVP